MVLRLSDFWSNWNLEMLVFEERGKPEYTEKKPLGATWERTNNKLNPHMASTPGLNPSHIAGRRVLSPLHHPCSPFLLFNTVFDSVSSTKKKADNLEANPGFLLANLSLPSNYTTTSTRHCEKTQTFKYITK